MVDFEGRGDEDGASHASAPCESGRGDGRLAVSKPPPDSGRGELEVPVAAQLVYAAATARAARECAAEGRANERAVAAGVATAEAAASDGDRDCSSAPVAASGDKTAHATVGRTGVRERGDIESEEHQNAHDYTQYVCACGGNQIGSASNRGFDCVGCDCRFPWARAIRGYLRFGCTRCGARVCTDCVGWSVDVSQEEDDAGLPDK